MNNEDDGLLQRMIKYFWPHKMFYLLLSTSGFSSFVGLLQYASSESGEIPWYSIAFVTLFAVILIGLIPFLLREIADRRTIFLFKPIYVFLYVWVFAISVCFAFAFWWDVFEANEATRTGTLAQYEDTQDTLQTAATSIEQSVISLNSIAAEFRAKADIEATSGNTCGVPSRGGPGPLTQLRRDQADRFEGWSRQLTNQAAAIGIIDSSIAEPTEPADSAAAASTDPTPPAAAVQTADPTRQKIDDALSDQTSSEDRARLLDEVEQELREDARNINSLRATVLIPRASDFRGLAEDFTTPFAFANPRASDQVITCLDQTARDILNSAADQLEAVPEIARPEVINYDGGTGTQEAIARFLNNFGLGWLVNAPEESQLTQADTWPLFLTFLVDFILLFAGLSRTFQQIRQEQLDRAHELGDEYRLKAQAEEVLPDIDAEHRGTLDLLLRTRLAGHLHELLVYDRGQQFFVLPTELPAGFGADITPLRDFLNLASQQRENKPIHALSSPRFRATSWLGYSARRAASLLLQRQTDLGVHSGIPWYAGSKFEWFRFDRRYPHVLSQLLRKWDLYQFGVGPTGSGGGGGVTGSGPGGSPPGSSGPGGSGDDGTGGGGTGGTPGGGGSGGGGDAQADADATGKTGSDNGNSAGTGDDQGAQTGTASSQRPDDDDLEERRRQQAELRNAQLEAYEANRLELQEQLIGLDAIKGANASRFAKLEEEATARLEASRAEERVTEIDEEALRTEASNRVRLENQRQMLEALNSDDPNFEELARIGRGRTPRQRPKARRSRLPFQWSRPRTWIDWVRGP